MQAYFPHRARDIETLIINCGGRRCVTYEHDGIQVNTSSSFVKESLLVLPHALTPCTMVTVIR